MLQAGEYGRLEAVLRQFDQNAGNADGKVSADEFHEAYRQLSSEREGPPVVAAGKLERSRDGTVRLTPAWKYSRNVPHVPSPLVFDGVLYLIANGVIVTALDPETGEHAKTGRIAGLEGNCYSSPVAADGKIFVISEDGSAAVIKANAQWETLSVQPLDAPCYATPALAAGDVFVRTENPLTCFREATVSGK